MSAAKGCHGSTENRAQFLREIEEFVQKECSEMGEILGSLSWTPDRVLQVGSVVQCPHDKDHLMPESSVKQHASVCKLKKAGLPVEEVELQLHNDDFFYTNIKAVGKVNLDEGLLNRIIWNYCMEKGQVHMGHRPMPLSSNEWSIKLTAQERLAVYDHCVQVLKEQGKMPNIEKDEVLTTDWERIVKKGLLEDDSETPKSRIEMWAMLRDQKRRRQTYRAKNVHITKKSYIEIIREVIMNQMEIFMPSGNTLSKKSKLTMDSNSLSSTHEDLQCHSHSRDRVERKSRSCSPKQHRTSSRSPKRPRSRSRSKKRHRSRSCSRSYKNRSRSRSRKDRSRSHSRKNRSRSCSRRYRSRSPRKSSPSRNRLKRCRRPRASRSYSPSPCKRKQGSGSPEDPNRKVYHQRHITSHTPEKSQEYSSQENPYNIGIKTEVEAIDTFIQKNNDSDDEGEIKSEEGDHLYQSQKHKHSKKSSKHKKHKHKQHKSKSSLCSN